MGALVPYCFSSVATAALGQEGPASAVEFPECPEPVVETDTLPGASLHTQRHHIDGALGN